MSEHLAYLESESAKLETDAATREQLNAMVLDYADEYLRAVHSAPAYRASSGDPSILDEPIPEHGRGLAKALDTLKTQVDRPGIATTSPRFFGYSGLADFTTPHWATCWQRLRTDMPAYRSQAPVRCASRISAWHGWPTSSDTRNRREDICQQVEVWPTLRQ